MPQNFERCLTCCTLLNFVGESLLHEHTPDQDHRPSYKCLIREVQFRYKITPPWFDDVLNKRMIV